MRLTRCLALLAAAAIPTTAILGASYSEVRERIHPGEVKLQDVDLNAILRAPEAFQNLRVRFRCVFVESSTLFDDLRTYFTPNNFANLIVYDDQADLSDPQVRSKPIMTAYIAKDRIDASFVVSLQKFQVIDLIGEVKFVMNGQPFINVHHIKPVPNSARLSDTIVYNAQQGNELHSEQSYELADQYYSAALASDMPDNNRVIIGLHRARNMMDWGQYDECAVTLRAALAYVEADTTLVDRKTRAYMHFLLAKAIAESGEQAATATARAEHFQEAIGHARKSVELDPEQGDAFAVLGITLAGQARYSEARRECEKAVRLRPTNAEVRWYLGRILDQEGSYEEAIEALRKAIDLTPKDHRMHKAIGAVYLHRGQLGGPKAGDDYISALREYDIAIRLNAADPESYFGSGQVIEAAVAANAEVQIGAARQAATIAMAVERYLKAVEVDGNFLPVRRTLANRYREDGQAELAIGQLKAIAEIEPDNLENFYELGRYLWSLDRKAEAVEAYEQAIVRHPGNLDALSTGLHVAVEAGANDKAQDWSQQLLAIDPEHGMGTLDTARLKFNMGQFREAYKLARYAEKYLTDKDAKEAAVMLQQDAKAALR